MYNVMDRLAEIVDTAELGLTESHETKSSFPEDRLIESSLEMLGRLSIGEEAAVGTARNLSEAASRDGKLDRKKKVAPHMYVISKQGDRFMITRGDPKRGGSKMILRGDDYDVRDWLDRNKRKISKDHMIDLTGKFGIPAEYSDFYMKVQGKKRSVSESDEGMDEAPRSRVLLPPALEESCCGECAKAHAEGKAGPCDAGDDDVEESLDEANPWHDDETGQWSGRARIKAKGHKGSASFQFSKRMLPPKTKPGAFKTPKGVKKDKKRRMGVGWKKTASPCGRAARCKGLSIRCSDGKPGVPGGVPKGHRCEDVQYVKRGHGMNPLDELASLTRE